MTKRQRALVSIVAIFGLLAMISAAWLKPGTAVASELKPTSKIHHLCAGPISNVSYLAEVKPRTPALPGTLSGALKAFLFAFTQQYALIRFDEYAIPAIAADRPLWLINRALLI